MIPPNISQAQRLAQEFARRFPVTVNGIPAGLSWTRPAGLVLPPNTPVSGRYGGRRNSPALWATWARERALGSTVTLRTSVRGILESYDLGGSTMEALGFLTWTGYAAATEFPFPADHVQARAMLGWVWRVYGLQSAEVR